MGIIRGNVSKNMVLTSYRFSSPFTSFHIQTGSIHEQRSHSSNGKLTSKVYSIGGMWFGPGSSNNPGSVKILSSQSNVTSSCKQVSGLVCGNKFSVEIYFSCSQKYSRKIVGKEFLDHSYTYGKALLPGKTYMFLLWLALGFDSWSLSPYKAMKTEAHLIW